MNSSIKYALRIQESIFPDKSRMLEAFSQVSVFHAPKQMVSGDFVFFESTENHHILALVDCTGHGVPGAMLSMLGYNLLYDAVNVEKLDKPDLILNYLEKNFKARLNQDDQVVTDGMEVAICQLDRHTKVLSFAGARRPLLIHTRSKETHLLRGSKRAIGGHLENVDSSYSKAEIQLQSGDSFFMFSDGFQDQFGGEEGKKFMSKKLRSLLEGISDQDGRLQEEQLNEAFQRWRGDHEQVDDVLVVGVRV